MNSLRLSPVVQNVVRALRRLYPQRQILVEDAHGQGSVICVQQDFEEMFANLLDNAMKWTKSSVRVSTRQIGKRMEIVVEDDGPGMSARDIEKVFEIGARLDESVPGSSFGLAIVRKRAQSRDGEVSLGASSMGGLSARLSLPVGG